MNKQAKANSKLTTRKDIIAALLIRRARTGRSAASLADGIMRQALKRELAELSKGSSAA